MSNEELKKKFSNAEEFEISGNDRLSDGIYKFFKGHHPATESYLFLRKKSALGTFENVPNTMYEFVMLSSITDDEVLIWVERGDIIYLPKSQIKFL